MRRRAALLVTGVALFLLAAGCRTPTGPGLHVTVRAEPTPSYGSRAAGGEVFGFGETVEASPSTAPTTRAAGRTNNLWVPGIVLWVEPAGTSGSMPARPPLDATVDARPELTRRPDEVQVASVGGRVTLRGLPPGGPAYVARGEGGETSEISPADPAFVPRRPGLFEVVGEGSDEPVARVYVAPTPWVRKMRGGERVTFAPLPPGRYTATTWHPILPGSSAAVHVASGPLTRLTLTVGGRGPTEPGPR